MCMYEIVENNTLSDCWAVEQTLPQFLLLFSYLYREHALLYWV